MANQAQRLMDEQYAKIRQGVLERIARGEIPPSTAADFPPTWDAYHQRGVQNGTWHTGTKRNLALFAGTALGGIALAGLAGGGAAAGAAGASAPAVAPAVAPATAGWLTPTVGSLVSTGIGTAANLYGASRQSGDAMNAAQLQADTANHAADLESKSAAEQLAYLKEQDALRNARLEPYRRFSLGALGQFGQSINSFAPRPIGALMGR